VCSSDLVDRTFLRVMKIPLLAGGGFDVVPAGDRVAIVNRSLARRFFGGDALGREIALEGSPDDDPGSTRVSTGRVRIIGIVADTVDWPLATNVPNQVYLPLANEPQASAYLVVRHAGPDALTVIRRDVTAIDSGAAVYDAATMDTRLARIVARQRLNTALAYGFAGFSLLLASLAVYGVMAYRVRRRGRELAIRIALGASPRAVERMIVGDGGRIVALGAVGGGLAALLLRPALNAVVYRPEGGGALTVALATGFVALIGLLATYLPALRAARTDSVIALRGD